MGTNFATLGQRERVGTCTDGPKSDSTTHAPRREERPTMNAQRIWRWGLLCVAALAVAGLWQATSAPANARAYAQSASASSVAVIDVAVVLEQLNERTDREN